MKIEDASKKYRQEPCEDTISRQAVLDRIKESVDTYHDQYTTDMLNMWGLFTQFIGEMPSVNPQKPNRQIEDYENEIEDLQNRLDIAEYDKERLREEVTKWNLKATIKALEQEPKTGRWIKISPADIYECSECGQNVMTSDICAYRHCHGCGIKMAESEDK